MRDPIVRYVYLKYVGDDGKEDEAITLLESPTAPILRIGELITWPDGECTDHYIVTHIYHTFSQEGVRERITIYLGDN